jgi:GntR family transcriptional repressor for pyruvate dehydrogenase complex
VVSTADNSDEADWSSLRKRRTHEHVLAAIEQQIVSGRLRAGDQLPPERQLADLLGVGRGSVREALRVLEGFGVLRANQGSGLASGSTLVTEPSEAMGYLLRLHALLSNFTTADIVDARIMSESWAARAAAERRDQATLAKLEALLGRMDDPGISSDDFNELDTQFHVTLCEASGNRLVAHLMQAIRDVTKSRMVAAFNTISDVPATLATLRRQHRDIYERIAAGDGAGAAERVATHIADFYKTSVSVDTTP